MSKTDKKATRTLGKSSAGSNSSAIAETNLTITPEQNVTSAADVLVADEPMVLDIEKYDPSEDPPVTDGETAPPKKGNTKDKKNKSSGSTKKPRMLRTGQLKLTDEFRARETECPKAIAEYENKYKDHMGDIVAMLAKDPSKVKTIIPPLGEIHVWRKPKVKDVADGKNEGKSKGKGKGKAKEEYEDIVTAGWHRVMAALKAGVPYLPCIIHTDCNAAVQAALETNRHGKQLSKADKKRSIEMTLAQNPDLTNQEIADRLGCTKRNIEQIVKEFNLRGEATTGKQSKQRTVKAKTKDALLFDDVKAILTPTLKAKCSHKERFAACVEALEKLAGFDGIVKDADCQEALQKIQDILAKHSAA